MNFKHCIQKINIIVDFKKIKGNRSFRKIKIMDFEKNMDKLALNSKSKDIYFRKKYNRDLNKIKEKLKILEK